MSDDKAPLEQVKAALASIISDNPHGSLYAISVEAFEQVYQRKYTGKPDRPELERIKYHARKLMAGDTSASWGGVRQGQGYRKPEHQEVTE